MAVDRRQALYDRIRSSTKDEVVLEEMVRLGFWPRRGTIPLDPADEIRERADMERELAALRTEQTRLGNVEALKKELLKRRLLESKQRQAETKARRERERVARAEAWKVAKSKDIVFLGRGVSGGLQARTSDEAKLGAQGLPVYRTPEDVAIGAGVPVSELRFLTYARTTSTLSHYQRFTLPKKSGGHRLISAPMPRLKKLQRWLLDSVLAKVVLHEASHGFRPDRSIVSNARPHVGAKVVVNLDLESFFPTVTFPRIRGVFRSLGYGEAVATIFALIASEPDTFKVELDGRTFEVAQGPRRLPQGAPTSPAITNVLCRRLDRRLFHAAGKLGFVYSRYADDLSFSSVDPVAQRRTGQLLKQVRFIVGEEGFVPHPEKTRVFHRGRQQEVTGLVVNDKVSVERETLRKFRALLHGIDTTGPEGKTWGSSPDVFASAKGFASYVAMVDPEKGRALLARVSELMAKYGYQPPPRRPRSPGSSLSPRPDAAAPPERSHGPHIPGSASSGAAQTSPPQTGSPSSPAAPAPAPEATPASPEGTPAEPPPKKKWWKLF